MTSSAKNVAAIGVPNRPAKPAAMPLARMMWRSRLAGAMRANCIDSVAPICTATPSRPALPPKRCVIQVEKIVSGTMRSGIEPSLPSPTSKTSPMPRWARPPQCMFTLMITSPATPRKGTNQKRCSARNSFSQSRPWPNTAVTTPTTAPIATASTL